MQFVRMTSLAGVAAIVTMAFAGTSSAMAGNTQICKGTDPANGKCATAATGTDIHLVAPTAILLAFFLGLHIEILCPNVLFQSTSIGALGAPQKVSGEFKYGAAGSCKELLQLSKCGKIEEVGTIGGTLDVLRTGDETGTVTGLEFEVLVECAGLHCVYEFEGLLGAATGALKGGHGKVSITSQTVKKVSGFACASSAILTITAESLSDIWLGL